MARVSQAGVVHLEFALRPDELIAAWRPDLRRLLLATREPLRLQQRVAVRIALVGPGAAATINGRVASASRDGSFHRIELVPDDIHRRAVERLLSIAQGARVEYLPRAPRFLTTMPVVVHGAGGPIYMNTFSVSEKGCGLTWSGPVPAVGAAVDVRVGAGTRTASFRSVVCWTARSGRTATVGVRFVAGPANAWAMMLTEVKRSGAPPA